MIRDKSNENKILKTKIAGVTLRSPFILSSGIMGLSASSLKRVADFNPGAVTTKSCGLKERSGHKGPVILPFPHGLLNAVGLSNPGVDEMVKELNEYRTRTDVPVIASIFGGNIREFASVAEKIVEAHPDMIEINVSCPNVHSEFGQPFGANAKVCGKITKFVKERVKRIPISVKLTASCKSISQVARACEDNGADVITAINSMGPGMIIDVNCRKPVLSNLFGGISGGAMLPVSIRCVWEIFKAVKIPIIGGGGVTSIHDALQMILAGATCVGIGSGVYFSGLSIFQNLNEDLKKFLGERKIPALTSLIGGAHG